MGAIELQVFVSLVVILGAAFVALICDFLKGNNEQLRESNIELKVRQDERDKRDLLVQEVQRQTIEVVTQVQRASGQRPAVPVPAPPASTATPKPKAESAATPAVPGAVRDARSLFEQAEQARQGRGRRDRRNAGAAALVDRPAASAEPQSPAAWAQEVYLRRFPQAESRRAAGAAVPEPVKLEAPAISTQEDIRTVLARTQSEPAKVQEPVIADLAPVGVQPVAAQPAAVQPELTPLAEPALEAVMPQAETLVSEPVAEAAARPAEAVEQQPGMAGATEVRVEPVQLLGSAQIGGEPVTQSLEAGLPVARLEMSSLAPAEAGRVEMAQAPVVIPGAPVVAEANHLVAPCESSIPNSGLTAEPAEVPAEPVLVEAEAGEQDIVSNVVRIRVLREEEVAVEPATVEEEVTALLAEEPAAQTLESEVEAVELPEEEPELLPVLETAAWAGSEEPAAASVEPAAQELSWLEIDLEPAALEAPMAEALGEEVPVETMEVTAAVEPELPAAVRSNVVEMPAGVAPKAQEGAPKEEPELVVPGGYHDPQALARLMEEEAPYRGLAMVVSLVDYVRLLADQGKPAMEQLMGSVSRLAVSMTREQDFACRISEDEFVLLFVKENGAAAKRRIQMVSERLWDFQLRSLGSVSIIFSWGAAESAGEPLARVVESAREQMVETRRNRRSLAGSGRFRRAAND